MKKTNTTSITNKIKLIDLLENKVIEEQVKMFRDAMKLIARSAGEEKALWQTIKTEIPTIGNKYKTVDEFISAAESGVISAKESSEIVKYAIKKSPEIAAKVKGLINKQPEFIEMAKLIFPKGTQMPADAAKMAIAQKTLSQMGIDAKTAEVMLKDAYQESLGAGKTVSKFKGVKGGDPLLAAKAKELKGSSPEIKPLLKDTKSAQEASSLVKDASNDIKDAVPNVYSKWKEAGIKLGKYSAKKFDQLKQLKGKMSAKKLILYGFMGYGSYEILKSIFGGKGGGTNNVLSDCVVNIPGAELDVDNTGSPYVLYKKDDLDEKSKGHGGLIFYDNNTVTTVDKKMNGTYACSTQSKLTVSESLNKSNFKLSIIFDDIINEQGNMFGTAGVGIPASIKSDDQNPEEEPKQKEKKPQEEVKPNITITWSGETDSNVQTTTYHNCDANKFPIEYKCRKVPNIKNIQIALGHPVKYQTGNFGPITKGNILKKGYTIPKEGITLELYNQIINDYNKDRSVINKLPTVSNNQKSNQQINPGVDDTITQDEYGNWKTGN